MTETAPHFGIDEIPEQWATAKFAGKGFNENFGNLEFCYRDDVVTYRFKTDQRHRNAAGVTHGGCLATFLDFCLGHEGIFRTHAPTLTIQLDTHFLQSVPIGATIYGSARVTRSTSSLTFISGELRVEDKIVATGSGVWKKFKTRRVAPVPS